MSRRGQVVAKSSEASKVHDIALQTNDEKTRNPASWYGCFSMKSDDDDDIFDADFCTDPDRFDM